MNYAIYLQTVDYSTTNFLSANQLNIISIDTNIIICIKLLCTNINTAKESTNICAITHGKTPFDFSFITPNIKVFPSIIK